MNVPSSLIRDRVLSPIMEARGENLLQQKIIANPTVDTDSIAGHLALVARTATPAQVEHIRAIARLISDLRASNMREGDQQRTVAGVVDQLAEDLRRHETMGRTRFGVQQLARALRGPLEIIVNARRHDGTRFVTAVRQIEDVMQTVPAAHLLDNVSLRHELGVTKYTALVDLIRRNQS